jgi:hypothetical protein
MTEEQFIEYGSPSTDGNLATRGKQLRKEYREKNKDTQEI